MKIEILPAYSLYDLYIDISRGRVNEFTYQGIIYKVEIIGLKYRITDPQGNTYTMPTPFNMTALQCAAANLNHYKCSLIQIKEELFTTDLKPIQ